MRRERERSRKDAAKLEMTPMIDVVFQLLIFFIVTLKQEDILSHLDVSRPAPEPDRPREVQVEDLLTILVYKEGFVLQGQRVSIKTLDRRLTKLAGYSTSVSVIIKCTADSPHSYLIKLLNICAKAGLYKLAVFSM